MINREVDWVNAFWAKQKAKNAQAVPTDSLTRDQEQKDDAVLGILGMRSMIPRNLEPLARTFLEIRGSQPE